MRRRFFFPLVVLLALFSSGSFAQSVFVTGDIHGLLEYGRLLDRPELAPGDYLLVLGDFGLVLSGSSREKDALDELQKQPYTILFVDGNHENFDLLAAYPEKKFLGGRVRQIRSNAYQLLRGEVFTIAGKTFFAFGGGYSKDRDLRVPGKSWWPQEAPSEAERENARRNLRLHNFKVDYIITHVPYHSLQVKLAESFAKKYPDRPPVEPEPDPAAYFLDEVQQKTQYSFWYNGHFHFTGQTAPKQSFVYRDILRLF